MKRIGRAARDERGTMLLELLTSTAIFLMVAATAMVVVLITVRHQPRISDRSASIQQARVFEERLIRELRPSYRVTAATAAQVSFLTFLRRSACAGGPPAAVSDPAIPCKVTYTLGSGAITRSETDPAETVAADTETLVSGVSNTDVFSYSPNASAPEYVAVKLVLEAEDGEDAITLQDGTDLRNR